MTAPGAIGAARAVVERAIADRVFPAAGVEVGSSAGVLWGDALGALTFDAGSPPARVDTLFDLASLTKAVATATVLMELARTARVQLEEPVSVFFAEWRGADRDHVTVRDLLEHASGLAVRLLDAPPSGRREFEHEICRMPLEYPPRAEARYSDLDFILLGFLASDRGDASLADLFSRIGLAGDDLRFTPPVTRASRTAPTLPLDDDARRGRKLVGEVHDNYAAALGGAAGHAGLFGSAPAVGAFARRMLGAARGRRDGPPPFLPELVAQFTARSTVPASSRALGWDTMLPSSSCGGRMSPKAFGHVGFTGTSLWIDPVRDRYFVLLTNRVCGGGSREEMRTVRRAFHDALGDF